jgi:hypothetical protein
MMARSRCAAHAARIHETVDPAVNSSVVIASLLIHSNKHDYGVGVMSRSSTIPENTLPIDGPNSVRMAITTMTQQRENGDHHYGNADAQQRQSHQYNEDNQERSIAIITRGRAFHMQHGAFEAG